jgi:hypothetical protein
MRSHYIRFAVVNFTLLVGATSANASDLSTSDVFAMMQDQWPEDKIVKHVTCREGEYDLDPQSYVMRSNREFKIPQSIRTAIEQTNLRRAGKGVPIPAGYCPIVRTKMHGWRGDLPISTSMVLTGVTSPVEARDLKYIYIRSSDSRWTPRAIAALKAHGKYEVVNFPEEAELFIDMQLGGGSTSSTMPTYGGPPKTTYTNYSGLSFTVRWYKKLPNALYSDKEQIEDRIIYYRFQQGSNAVEASFKHFLRAADGPKPKVKKDKKAKS